MYVHADCTGTTRRTPLVWVLRGQNQGRTCGPIGCMCEEYLLWGHGAFDLVVGNRVCNNVRPCELYMTCQVYLRCFVFKGIIINVDLVAI